MGGFVFYFIFEVLKLVTRFFSFSFLLQVSHFNLKALYLRLNITRYVRGGTNRATPNSLCGFFMNIYHHDTVDLKAASMFYKQ